MGSIITFKEMDSNLSRLGFVSRDGEVIGDIEDDRFYIVPITKTHTQEEILNIFQVEKLITIRKLKDAISSFDGVAEYRARLNICCIFDILGEFIDEYPDYEKELYLKLTSSDPLPEPKLGYFGIFPKGSLIKFQTPTKSVARYGVVLEDTDKDSLSIHVIEPYISAEPGKVVINPGHAFISVMDLISIQIIDEDEFVAAIYEKLPYLDNSDGVDTKRVFNKVTAIEFLDNRRIEVVCKYNMYNLLVDKTARYIVLHPLEGIKVWGGSNWTDNI